MPSDSRIALITGSTRGIGFATARMLAQLGFQVVLTGRSQSDSDKAAARLLAEVPSASASGMALDLSSFASVRAFATGFLAKGWPLHVLINNAGTLDQDPKIRLTGDGLEFTLQTNVFGPFLLTRLLVDLLQRSAPARIVSVGSRVHLPKSGLGGEVNWEWDNLRGERSFDPMVAYKNSKLATMWFTYELNRRLEGKGVTVTAVCPGFVPETVAEHAKGLRHFLFKHVMTHLPNARTVEQAAGNTVFAATSPAYATRGGVFIGEEHEVEASEQARNPADIERFWKLACQLTGLDPALPPAP